MEEHALIQGVIRGDRACCHALFRLYKDKVFNTALSMLQSREDAEDITQEVFAQIFLSMDKFRRDARLSTWIYRITVTQSLDHIRKHSRQKRQAVVRSLSGAGEEGPELQLPDFHHPGVALEEKEKGQLLFAAIDRLPEQQKAAFILHKLEGLSYQEVSEVLQTSLSAVESLMHRARENLKKYLREYFNEK